MKILTQDKDNIYVDNNMLGWGRQCERYGFYRMEKSLVLYPDSPATHFGSMWHQGMYGLWGKWNEEPWDLERGLKRIEQFDPQYEVVEKGKTYARLRKALVEYSGEENYAGFAQDCDSIAAEEFMMAPLFTYKGKMVQYCGIIDRILRLPSGEVACLDYKTTSWNRVMDEVWQLSPQFIGYCWLVNKITPEFKVNTFILDLFQCQAKETNKFLRRFIDVPDWMIEEWVDERVKEIRTMLDSSEPYAKNPACSDYGGCPYFSLCKEPPEAREGLMEVMYTRKVWDIHGNVPVMKEE